MERGRESEAPAPVLEAGWVVDQRLEPVDREATERAREVVLRFLRREHPDYEWRMPLVRREMVQAPREEPVTLLDVGATELSLYHWDFALVVSAADLESYYEPSALAVVSRTLAVGVLSTFRIDPVYRSVDVPDEERRRRMERRLVSCAMWILGRLSGLPECSEPTSFMRRLHNVDELDEAQDFTDGERREMARELARIADERVEEETGSATEWGLSFYLRSVWRNRSQLVRMVAENRAWEFPFRLSRLTTAAVSAVAVLMMTAEAWELGASLSVAEAAGLSALALVTTSVYVVQKQRLVPGMRPPRRTEQSAVARVSVGVFVAMGMLSTYLFLLAASFLLGRLLFDAEVLARWLGREPGSIGSADYLAQGALTAALGILIGSLGASFEGQQYVRHIAYVDDERSAL